LKEQRVSSNARAVSPAVPGRLSLTAPFPPFRQEWKGAHIHRYAMVRRGEAPRPLGEESRRPMAIFSMRMQVIGRSAGRSATAAAAYRSGEQLTDERTGQVHDYTGKSDIYGSEILGPENAPARLCDRATLWNEVERIEKRKDAQLSREVMVALPVELSHDQKETLTREYVQAEFVSQGMIADIGYHDFDSHNPHAHIMLTMRDVDADGFGKKRRDWNKRAEIERHRQAWAESVNKALEQAGYDERIDHRSLKVQGIDREPQIHLGAKVLEMEARGIQTRVGDESRRISKVNRDIARQAAKLENLSAEIAAEPATIQPISPAEISAADDLTSEVTQSPVDPLAFLSDPAWIGSFAEAIIERWESVLLEELLERTELSGVVEAVLDSMDGLSTATEKVQRLIDAKRRQVEQAGGPIPAPPVEQKPEPVQRQEQPQPRQKKKAKERDQGYEM
jgi:MobA/MobL family